ncbi:hypothetical protein [Lacticaseibacillus suihuaensis]
MIDLADSCLADWIEEKIGKNGELVFGMSERKMLEALIGEVFTAVRVGTFRHQT